mmetsp:Transcript_55701/g.118475  ORF Transcript_55701/g.118475 Transcript_55701/m.118475 type:complete len:607 (-) Transcript_55701:281-2101(-)
MMSNRTMSSLLLLPCFLCCAVTASSSSAAAAAHHPSHWHHGDRKEDSSSHPRRLRLRDVSSTRQPQQHDGYYYGGGRNQYYSGDGADHHSVGHLYARGHYYQEGGGRENLSSRVKSGKSSKNGRAPTHVAHAHVVIASPPPLSSKSVKAKSAKSTKSTKSAKSTSAKSIKSSSKSSKGAAPVERTGQPTPRPTPRPTNRPVTVPPSLSPVTFTALTPTIITDGFRVDFESPSEAPSGRPSEARSSLPSGSPSNFEAGPSRTPSCSIQPSGAPTATPPLTSEQREAIISSKCGRTVVSRSLALLELIGKFVSDPEESLVSQEGPRYDAYVWLAHFDDAILCPPSGVFPVDNVSVRDEQEKRILQRYALAATYFSLDGDGWANCSAGRRWRGEDGKDDEDNGNGAGWSDDDYYYNDDATKADNATAAIATPVGPCSPESGQKAVRFLDASHECDWFGLSCGETDGNLLNSGTSHDVDNNLPITEISLPRNNLEGTLPIEFYDAFARLKSWNVEGNGMGGTLSEGVGRLEELEVLKLSDNDLEGAIPFNAISSLERLGTLNLDRNGLRGDATGMCDILSSKGRTLDSFETDCGAASPASVICPCCTRCT